MQNYDMLQRISYALDTASKIKIIMDKHNTPVNNGRFSLYENNIRLIGEILKVIHEKTADGRLNSLNTVIEAYDFYNPVYRNLKEHVHQIRSDKLNPLAVTKSIEIMKPLFNTGSKSLIDKITAVIKILGS